MMIEVYADVTRAFRAQIITYKKMRQVLLRVHMMLFSNSELTSCYQVQEMPRVELIFERDDIKEMLAVDNPLVLDGTSGIVTF